jgi:cobyrinic acid a,c-diamide synthase
MIYGNIIREVIDVLSMRVPRLLISSDRSDSGKTLITSGILKALSKRMRVRGFKAGPDFIDPGYHKLASGSPSINLDLFIMGKENVIKSLCKYSKDKDISVIEGVMGLYDGVETEYSTYKLSEDTRTPIVLVIDCYNVGSTVGAIVKGLVSYRNANVKGVILNRVASQTHFTYCRNSIEGVKVLGYIPFSKELSVPSRHLGLFTVESNREAEKAISKAAELVENYVDVDSLVEIAKESPEIECPDDDHPQETSKKVAAIAYDEAFNFYYYENLDRISKRYELRFFSPLNGDVVEGADFIYIGGGYPELFVEELEKSKTKEWVKRESERGKPILGECGGLMFLSSNLIKSGRKFKMAGVFDIDIETLGKLTLGYTELLAVKDSFITDKGKLIRGHEFHVSYPVRVSEEEFAFENKRGKGILNGKDGVMSKNTLGTYTHFHFSIVEKRTVF